MKLKKLTGRDKVTRVYIVESFRDVGGKTRQRTVESLGRLDVMLAADPAAWEKARARCDELTAARNGSRGVVEWDTTQPWDGLSAVNVGWLLVDAVLSRLGVVRVARAGRGRNGATTGIDVASLTRLLVVSRVVWPCSKLRTWQRQGLLFGGPVVNDLGHMYSGLDDVADLAAAFQRAAWDGSGRTPAQLTTVDYDVTNYFFHIDTPDPAPVGKDTDRGQATRQKGYSKEHRPDPIIQMGLFLDSEGIPVSYRLFDGNVPDMSTLAGAIREFKTVFAPGRVVVVADKGLNTGPNIVGLHDRGDGWIVGASHRRDRNVRAWILDPVGWQWNPEHTAKVKSRVTDRVIRINKTDTTPARTVTVQETTVVSWSVDAQTRDRATREELLTKAERFVADESAWRANGKRGPRKYVKSETVDPVTGEILTGRETLLTVNQELADQDAEMDGYHMVRTSETNLAPQAILDRYHQLWQIEHAFRVSKTDLETRPVYVRLPPHIEAHFLICFLALLATRLLQKWTGLPSGQLVETIRSFQATPLSHGIYRLQRPGWDTIDQATGVPLDQNWATTEQLRNWARQLAITTKTITLPTTHKPQNT
jgi:hypothetical protein